ncbi:MAG: Bacterial Ig-like domain (group 2) [bacterium ADurb.Bin429]|nr:MAG: Bacterial Ig-like domain (group 2) [bacterium ADurb.Bin429]
MIRVTLSISLLLVFGILLPGCDEEIIIPPVPSLSITPSAGTLYPGQKVQLVTVVTNASTQATSWQSSNPSVATVDANGEVTAVNPGSAVIMASVTGTSITDSAAIIVEAPPVPMQPLIIVPRDVEVSKDEVAGATMTFDAFANSNPHPVNWTVVTPGGGSFDPQGVYTFPTTVGTFTIRATCAIDNVTFTTTTVTVK